MASTQRKAKLDPFRRAVWRGVGIVLPPLLTVVIFLWVGNTIVDRLLVPMESFSRWAIIEASDIRSDPKVQVDAFGLATIDGKQYWQANDGQFVPLLVYSLAKEQLDLTNDQVPGTAKEVYEVYVDQTYLRREYVIPVFLAVLVLVMYLLGKFMAAGVGRFFWNRFELLIHRVPIVRNVYSSVKQVTDFLFTDPDVEYTRVVALEYPRRGMWSLGFVTGDSMIDIRCAANEPVLTVLIPTSPMPFTGYTVTVKKSETIDLNISIDQAFQFIISCGVVVPPQQLAEALEQRAEQAVAIGAESVVGSPEAVPTAPLS